MMPCSLELRNSRSVLWYVPDIFSCIYCQEIKMKWNIYQQSINGISAVFINYSFRKIWEIIFSYRPSELNLYIAVGEIERKWILNFRYTSFFFFKADVCFVFGKLNFHKGGCWTVRRLMWQWLWDSYCSGFTDRK